MTTIRKERVAKGNNPQNSNKNVCALAVATALHVQNETRYLHTMPDLLKASRKKWDVRSRKSSVKGKTVGSIRGELDKFGASAYIVQVDGHVLLLNEKGHTMVDTDPRKKDKRKVKALYAVYPQGLIHAIEQAKIIADRIKILRG